MAKTDGRELQLDDDIPNWFEKMRKMKHFTDDHECYMNWNVQYFGFFEVKIAVRKTSQFFLQII